MSFCSPAGEEDSLVLDFGAMHDLSVRSKHRDEIAKLASGLAFRTIGLGAICQTWGGFLAGLPLEEKRAIKDYSGANQGALLMTFRIDMFVDPEDFKKEIDDYIRQVRKLEPVIGFDQSHLPGGIEAEREREYREIGVPVGPEHRERLEEVARELGIGVPWE